MADCTNRTKSEREDDILSHGVRTIRTYLASISAPLNPRQEPMSEVRHVLVSARIDDWCKGLPDGLSVMELAWATRYSVEEVMQGIAALRSRPTDPSGWRLVETEVEGFRRYAVRWDEGSR